MLYFKSCLRCKDGTVELGSDNYGVFLNCLTCGYTINSRSIRSNGSIEQPVTLDDDAVRVPVQVTVPVAVAGEPVGGQVDADRKGDGFGPDPDITLFEDDLEELEFEADVEAVI